MLVYNIGNRDLLYAFSACGLGCSRVSIKPLGGSDSFDRNRVLKSCLQAAVGACQTCSQLSQGLVTASTSVELTSFVLTTCVMLTGSGTFTQN